MHFINCVTYEAILQDDKYDAFIQKRHTVHNIKVDTIYVLEGFKEMLFNTVA